MATEVIHDRLIVKNFGPIKHAEVEIKDLNVFIGPTGSGKSTIAKLIAIFSGIYIDLSYPNVSAFKTEAIRYNLVGYETDHSYIKYTFFNGRYTWKLENGKVTTNYPYSNLYLFNLNIGINNQKIFYSRLSRALNELDSIHLPLIKSKSIRASIAKAKSKLYGFIEANQSSKSSIPVDSIEAEQLIVTMRELQLKLGPELPYRSVVFIPAERMFFSVLSKSINTIINTSSNEDVPFPGFLSRFASSYEYAEFGDLTDLIITEMGLSFTYKNNDVYLKDSEEHETPLRNAASGIQSLYPAAKTVAAFGEMRNQIVLEEPELNLFPEAQFNLVKFLTKFLNLNPNLKLILTTHSPYILSAIDNLVLAHNVANEKKKKKKEVNDLVPEQYQIAYERINALYFNPKPKRGKPNTESILNPDRKGISGNAIDGVSEELNSIFEHLTDLRYS